MADLFDDMKPGGVPAPTLSFNQYERGKFIATPQPLPDAYRGTLIPAMGADVLAFNEKFGLTYDGPIRLLPDDLTVFRTKFLFEELFEFSLTTDPAEEFDALIDFAYVAVGTVLYHGVDFDSEVQRSMLPHIGSLATKRVQFRPTMKSAEVTRFMMQLSKYMSINRGYFDENLDALIYGAVYAQQCAVRRGWDFAEGWRRVQAANMAKVRTMRAEDSKRGDAKYDIVKPPGWTPPDHSDLVSGSEQET